jgi:hypothetical protein
VRLPVAEWERVRRLPIADLPRAMSEVAKAARVPVAGVDFGVRPVGENRPQECLPASFMVKQVMPPPRMPGGCRLARQVLMRCCTLVRSRLTSQPWPRAEA